MKRALTIAAVLVLVLCAAAVVWSARPVPPPDLEPSAPTGPGPAGPGPVPPVAPPQPRPGMVCAAMALMPPTPLIEHLDSQLQMTDEQKQKVQALRTKFDETQMPLRQKASEATKALHDAVLADDYDAKKVEGLTASAQKAEAALLAAELDAWNQIRSILTGAQLTKLRELLSGPIRQPGGLPPVKPEPAPRSGPAPLYDGQGPPAPTPAPK